MVYPARRGTESSDVRAAPCSSSFPFDYRLSLSRGFETEFNLTNLNRYGYGYFCIRYMDISVTIYREPRRAKLSWKFSRPSVGWDTGWKNSKIEFSIVNRRFFTIHDAKLVHRSLLSRISRRKAPPPCPTFRYSGKCRVDTMFFSCGCSAAGGTTIGTRGRSRSRIRPGITWCETVR